MALVTDKCLEVTPLVPHTVHTSMRPNLSKVVNFQIFVDISWNTSWSVAHHKKYCLRFSVCETPNKVSFQSSSSLVSDLHLCSWETNIYWNEGKAGPESDDSTVTISKGLLVDNTVLWDHIQECAKQEIWKMQRELFKMRSGVQMSVENIRQAVLRIT